MGDLNSQLALVPERLKNIMQFQFVGCKHDGKLIAGYGASLKLNELLRPYGGGKILFVVDKVFIDNGVVEFLGKSLKNENIGYDLFYDIPPEPHIDSFRKCQDMVRGSKYSAIVGMGGGSVMDIAKAAAVCATNSLDILEYCQGAVLACAGLPCILLPTTSGTGSEVSPYLVTSHENKKLFFGSPYMIATIAVVDPLLTVSMPPRVTAGTGLDALAHAVEGYIGTQNPLTEIFTAKSIEYVMRYLKRACLDGKDYEARYYMAFAAVYGMLSYSQGGGLYAHSLSYILTLDKNLEHGAGCGLGLPYTIMFNLNAAAAKQTLDDMARYTGLGSAKEMAEAFFRLVKEINMPSSLKELGVSLEQVDPYAEILFRDYYRKKNPRPMSLEESRLLMRSMWDGELREIPTV